MSATGVTHGVARRPEAVPAPANARPPGPKTRLLCAGRELGCSAGMHPWRVCRGVIGIVQDPAGNEGRAQYLALPGDLIAVEELTGEPLPARIFAVTAAEIEAVACREEHDRNRLLSLAYAQSRRQGCEFLRLHTGSLTDRVRQLLLLLGGVDVEEADVELPSLRQLAELLDASPEAICRVLGGMRQLEVLVARQPRRVRILTRALADLVPPQGMSSGLQALRQNPAVHA